MSDNQDLQSYFDLMTMNGSAYVFNIANKMQLFKVFQSGQSLSAKEVALTLNYQEKTVELILKTLANLNLLLEDKLQYQLAPVAKLLTGDYENLASDYWEHLPVLLQTGTTFKKMDSVDESEDEYQKQATALKWMMTPSAKLGAQFLNVRYPECKTIMDVGAGSGVWSHALLELNQQAHATLIDWTAVLNVAKACADQTGLHSRVSYLEGNYFEVEYPENKIDIAIMANVTHLETKENNIKLFNKMYNTLNDKGKLVIFDSFSTNPKGATSQSLYEIGLAIRTEHAQVFQPKILQSWLKEIGFSTFEFINLDVTPFTMGMLVASK